MLHSTGFADSQTIETSFITHGFDRRGFAWMGQLTVNLKLVLLRVCTKKRKNSRSAHECLLEMSSAPGVPAFGSQPRVLPPDQETEHTKNSDIKGDEYYR